MNPLQRIKVGMLLFGSIFGAAIGARDLSIALSETEATVFEITEFDETYNGQQWLNVHGQLATEHAHIRPSTTGAHAGKGLAYVQVPIVAADWEPSKAVHVVATFGPIEEDRAIDWAALTQGEPSVSGQVRPSPLPDLDTMFPGLSFPEPPVVINVGTEPSPPLLIGGFTAFMAVTALLCALGLCNELRSESRKA